MSIGNDYNSNDIPITDAESDNFAATPVWDRGRKRRGFGGGRKIAAEPRSFVPEREVARDEMVLDTPMTATNSTLAAEEPMAAPIGRTTAPRTVRSHASSGASASVIAGALIAVVAVGGVAWYATRDHSGGVPTLASAPESTTSQVAAAPAEPAAPAAAPPTQMASDAAPPPMAERAPPRERIAPAHRARPATTARAAGETGVNASTTAALPDGPQPYSSVNPGAAPQPVNPAAPPSTVQGPPATTAPAPAQTAPTTPAPPPVQPQQAPTTAPADQQTPPADTTPPSA